MRWLLCLLACSLLFTAACSSMVKGSVFLDVNGNLTQDKTEPFLSGVVLAVTAGDKALGEAETGGEGSFEFIVDPKDATTEKSNYCVTIQEMSLLVAQKVALVEEDAEPAIQAVALQRLETASSEGTEEESGSTQTSEDNSQETPEAEKKTDNSSEDNGTTKQELGTLKACKEGTGEVEIRVSIAPKYDSVVSAIASPPTATLAVLEETTEMICYPQKCSLEEFSLPQGLENCSSNVQFDVSTRQMKVSVDEKEATSSASRPGHEITCETICVRLTEEAEGDLSFTPTVVCPDNSKLTLHSHNFKLGEKQIPLLVEQSIVNGTLALGETVTVQAKATNNGPREINAAKMVLEVPQFSTITSLPEGCNNLGEKVECATDLALGGSVTRQISFTLPSEITKDTTFDVNTSLSGATLETPVSAEKITFSIVGPPPAEAPPES